jgi:hypothetical protein
MSRLEEKERGACIGGYELQVDAAGPAGPVIYGELGINDLHHCAYLYSLVLAFKALTTCKGYRHIRYFSCSAKIVIRSSVNIKGRQIVQ